jgi:hypothetical protein
VNLDLLLYELGDPLSVIASSVSTIDNVEHLFLSLASAGQYALAVHSVGGLVDPLPYALAWSIVIQEFSLPGDYNDDGVVDAADYVVWRKNDGTQDAYNIWREHFGETASSGAGAGSPSSTSVPEPASLAVLLAAMLPIRYRRRNDIAIQKLFVVHSLHIDFIDSYHENRGGSGSWGTHHEATADYPRAMAS